jgi:hypothetical protein
MKKDLKFILIVLITFALPLATSTLLDVKWINDHWTRISLIIILMAFEIAVCIFILKEKLKK